MSYMTPYYFSASIGQVVSVWMRSTDFQSKVGLALSGATTALITASNNAWGCGDTFYGSAFRYTCPSSSVYLIEATSSGSLDTGSFKLYITAAETSSVDMNYSGSSAGFQLVYSPNADRIFGIGTTQVPLPTGPHTSSLIVVNPRTSTVTNPLYYDNTRIFDEFYNPHTDTVWVWLTGSNALWDGEFLVEYQGNGILVVSHSVSNVWPAATNGAGTLAYNSASNHVLMVPNVAIPATASIYDCLSNTILQYVPLPSSSMTYPTYVTSNDNYYVYSSDGTTPTFKINATSYVTSIVTSMTGSGYGFSYVPEVDKLFHENQTGTACIVVDPSTDTPAATIPGIIDFQWAVYDRCGNSIALSDDNSTNNSYTDGGVSYVSTNSYSPTNFQHLPGNWPLVYCSSTSTVFVGNWNDNIVYSFFSATPTGSLPQPPYPPSASLPLSMPINLMVTSGSAILNWELSGTLTPDYYEVYKSTTGEVGPYTQITTSLTTRAVDTDVDVNRTYWYKVKGVASGGATSSFSNEAAIDLIHCNKPFDPIVYSEYLSYSSGSTYKNIYGKLIPYTASVSHSISVWGRSPDFDVYLTLVDNAGNILIENDYDGWVPSGDKAYPGNAAFTYNLPSGSYNIEVSSLDNAVGRFSLIVSPGPKLETTWSNSYETATCEYIPTSNCVVVGEQGTNILWYNIDQQSSSIRYYQQGVQGIAYSPVQDKVYAWVYLGNGTVGWTASIEEFDNTGSLVGRTQYYRPLTVASAGSTLSQTGNTIYLHTGGAINDFTTQAESGSRIWFNDQSTQGYITSILNADTASVDISQTINYDPDFFDFGTEFLITRPQVTPNPDFSGYMTYDPKHDRIAFYRYFYATNHIFNIWDVASKTFTASLNAAPYTNFYDMWEGCYSWADDCFYIGTTTYQHLVKVNATTFAITASNNSVKTKIVSSYASASGLLMLRGNGTPGKVIFADPVTETVVHTQNDLPTTGLFEGTGKSGDPNDPCSNAYVITIDPQGGPNYPALALLDRNTFLPLNYLTLNSDNPGGFGPDGWYQYSIAFSPSSSRIYSAQVSYDNYEGRLYSIIPTRAYMPILSPFTSSASDTASCMTFKSQFPVTASGDTRATADYVCSSKTTGSNVRNTMVVSDFELNDLFNGMHNFNNYFLSSSGEQLNNYKDTYIHTYSGKNAVFCNGKFYMMSDGVTEQGATYEPVSGSSMLVFDETGSYVTSIPLTYGGRDWGTDGTNVYIYEIDAPTSGCYVETIDSTTDAISSTDQLQVGYVTVPGFAFTYATASATASAAQTQFNNQVSDFGRIVAFADNQGDTYIYYNNIYGNNVLPNGTQTFLDTGSGDRIWAAGYTGYALYNYPTKLHMGEGSGYTKWCGSAGYCPITDHVYWGATDINDNPVLIETTKNLAFVNTHSMARQIHSIAWNRRNRTMDLFSNELSSGRMYIFDPVANTTVCTITTLTAGGITTGLMGYSIDVNVNTGDVYVPQRKDGATSPSTGSVKLFQV